MMIPSFHPNIQILDVSIGNGNLVTCILHNKLDHEKAYVKVECHGDVFKIVRFDGLSVFNSFIAIDKEIDNMIARARNTPMGYVITRRIRIDTIQLSPAPRSSTPMVASFPVYGVDVEMCNAVQSIIDTYRTEKKTLHATRIQTAFRAWRARRKYNVTRLRIMNDLLLLPPGFVHSSFPGGYAYQLAAERFHAYKALTSSTS